MHPQNTPNSQPQSPKRKSKARTGPMKCRICRRPACYRSRLRGMRRWVYFCAAHAPMPEIFIDENR